MFQSTLPVWGGTEVFNTVAEFVDVSIHPPRVGRDPGRPLLPGWAGCFNPPSPCGEGLWYFIATLFSPRVSIHPPRVGRDSLCWRGGVCPQRFNPPSPCGEGRCGYQHFRIPVSFQSTLPVWGGTRGLVIANTFQKRFNPPSPCGEGQQKLTKILCKLLR